MTILYVPTGAEWDFLAAVETWARSLVESCGLVKGLDPGNLPLWFCF